MTCRKLLVIVAVVVLPSGASAQVFHEVDVSRQNTTLNTTVGLESEYPVDRWELDWSVPEGSELISVRDSAGEALYNRTGENLEIRAGSSKARRTETFRIVSVQERRADFSHAGLWERRVSLPGMKGTNTTGVVRVDSLISWRTSYGFHSGGIDSGLSFRGTGPVTLSVKAGEGNKTRYFEFFGGGVKGVQEAFEVAAGTTGLTPRFERFAVAVLPGEKYDRTVNEWSQGEYVNGRIRIRQGLEEDLVPVLAHEVVHGLNDRRLSWDQTRSKYFDEGVASYVENILKEASRRESGGRPIGELFGDKRNYDPDVGDDTFLQIPPRGDPDRLWSYYQQNRSFMQTWRPQGSTNRRFGYAYSELVIRKYVADGGSLRGLYKDLEPGHEITTPDEKWSFYSQHVDMTPCEFGSRERFDRCLGRVRGYEYTLSRATPEPSSEAMSVRRVELPRLNRQDAGTSSPSRISTSTTSIDQLVSEAVDFIAGLF